MTRVPGWSLVLVVLGTLFLLEHVLAQEVEVPEGQRRGKRKPHNKGNPRVHFFLQKLYRDNNSNIDNYRLNILLSFQLQYHHS